MISIKGIGWINKEEYGCVLRDISESYKDKTLPKKRIFTVPFKNFGRFDNISKLTCAAIALALKDAGIEYSIDRKQNIGIISTNTSGSYQTDMFYFSDYLNSGRTLSRGNLFIYTLPSSPSGEAAIHFGLQGPLLYVAEPHNSIVTALETAAEMISFNEASTMLAGMAEESCAIYFVLKKGHNSALNELCNLDQAIKILNRDFVFDEIIKALAYLKKGDDIQ
jgi:3-oxoacyl-(acyl-carrier-protein) synthase